MSTSSSPAGAEAGATADHRTAPAVLSEAVAAYAADADHVARSLIIGLLLEGAVTQAEVNATVQDGLSEYRLRMRSLREQLGSATSR
jgi:hypothetical protein